MSKFQEISSLIWKISDDVLRMKFKENEYGKIILPFVLLRRLDCVLEPNKDEIFKLFEEYKKKIDDPSPIIINKIKQSFYNVSKYDLSFNFFLSLFHLRKSNLLMLQLLPQFLA